MRSGLLMVAAIAACKFEPAPAASDAPIVVPDTPPDGSPDVDTDMDGRFDDADNCPAIANADQHDEDADDFGDVCDPCPQLAAVQPDADSDGIGDGCDPNPNLTGDVLVRFEPFTGTALDAAWIAVTGMRADWTVSGDALRMEADGSPHALMFDIPGATRTQIDFTVTMTSAGLSTPHVAGLGDLEETANQYYLCTVFPTTNNPQAQRQWALQHFETGTFLIRDSTTTTPPDVGQTIRVIVRIDPNNQRCETSGLAQAMTSIDTLIVDPGVGIRVRDMTVTIPYAAIYRSD